MLLCFASTQVYASSLDDAQQDKNEAEENKSDAEQILNQLEADKNDLELYVQELDAELSDIQVSIDKLNADEADLQAQIEQKQADLEVAKEQEVQQYADMCARIQYMYENNNEDYAAVLLSAESMSDILNQSEYVAAMTEYDYNMLETLIQIREQIASDEQKLQEDLQKVEALQKEKEEEEATLSALIDAKNERVAQLEDDIEDQEALVAKYDAEIQAAASRIAEIEAAAAAAAAAGDASTNGGEEYVPYTGGVLTWPCPSSTKINSGFGTREASGVVTANHYGIDIGCPDGTPIVAAASGVVVLARYSATAGNWIIISHGNGLYTIYMHASTLYVSEGQYVNAGDTIMLSGATGATQGRHLHFEVRVGGYLSSQYSVDPMSYFN